MSLSGRMDASQTTHCLPGLTTVSAQVPQTTCPQQSSSFDFPSSPFFFFFFGGSAPAGDLELRSTHRVAFVISREHDGQIGLSLVAEFESALLPFGYVKMTGRRPFILGR